MSRTFDPFREVSTRQVNLRNRSVDSSRQSRLIPPENRRILRNPSVWALVPQDAAGTLANVDDLIRFQFIPCFFVSTRPVDYEAFNVSVLSQSKMNPDIART